MTNYCISYGNSDDNFIQVSLKIDKLIGNYSYFQLPAWRPGRYELGNFAQNMFKLNVINEKGETLECKKISKDKWLVNNTNAQEITLTYTYACVIKNAGGTFKSPKQLIVTPVNCLIYAEHLIKEACTIEIQTPENFKQISSVKNNTCSNYYELAASPFVCGTEIKQECYTLKGINFHVVFEGKVNPNWKKIIHDFSLFTLEQLELFKTFPSTDYYFLNLIFEEQHYHGVEHLDSTLIALGPDSSFEEESFYNNLLGISSHELFHYWNICRIRPKELMPYDYTKETYFETGYIAEGLTTYYGDYLLGRSKTITIEQCLDELGTTITRHLVNPAKDKVSVAESSIDLWLDGYKAGVPGRKVSIYHKGACIAMLLDLWLRTTSSNQKSLDNVMQLLWRYHGESKVGYTSKDYKNYIDQVSGKDATWYFERYVFGTDDIEKDLFPLLNEFGLELVIVVGDEKESLNYQLKLLTELNDKQKQNFNAWMKSSI